MNLIPLHITTQKLGKHFLFRSNVYIDPKKIRQFPKYCQEISKSSSNLSVPSKTSSNIASEIIWHNKHMLVDKMSFYNTTGGRKELRLDQGINHVGQFLDTNGAMKSWSLFKSEFS